MKFTELMNEFTRSSFKKLQINNHINALALDMEISEKISIFLEKLNDGKQIPQREFTELYAELSKLDIQVRQCINYLIYIISSDIVDQYLNEINEDIKSIDTALKEGTKPAKNSGVQAEKYLALLNCYQLLSQASTQQIPFGLDAHEKETINYLLPFAINTLRIVGKLPTTEDFHGFNLSKPYYPSHLGVIKNETLPLSRGVKNSEEYYPYRRVSKIAKGDTGDNTFVATNGKKILFIRGVERYAPNAVLASKIATLISPRHFSSERLFNNRLVGSRGIETYACSAADPTTRNARKRYIEVNQGVFPGSGIIDEVTNFVQETDPNIENFGFSSTKIEESHLSKIDFDRCTFSYQVTKGSYEQDILTKFGGGIYHGLPHVSSNPDYLREKLFTRLKLSLLPELLFSQLANKAYAPEDAERKAKAIKECASRAQIAADLFLKHESTREFLQQNPNALDQCYQEISQYISSHFDADTQEILQRSLKEQANRTQKNLNKTFQVELSLELPDKVSFFEAHSSNKEQSASDSISNKAMPTLINSEKDKAVTNKSESSFLSRHWFKFLGITLFALIGLAIGITLTATGVLAPFGVGAIGITLSGVIGFTAGLGIGGTLFGSKIVYDEYLYHRHEEKVEAQPEETLHPSPEVQAVLGQTKEARIKIDQNFSKIEAKLQKSKNSSSPQDEDVHLITDLSLGNS